MKKHIGVTKNFKKLNVCGPTRSQLHGERALHTEGTGNALIQMLSAVQTLLQRLCTAGVRPTPGMTHTRTKVITKRDGSLNSLLELGKLNHRGSPLKALPPTELFHRLDTQLLEKLITFLREAREA